MHEPKKPGDVGAKIAAQSASLRELLAQKSTEAVVGWCASYNLRRASDMAYPGRLHSPYRQLTFLFGLLLGTPEPAERVQVEEEEWERIMGALNALFDTYRDLFFPTAEGLAGGLPPEWTRVRDVAMPAFLHHFFSGLLASADQVRARVQRYVAPFDAELRDVWGISATEALEVADWITDALQSTLDDAQKVANAERAARLALLRERPASLSVLRERAAASGYRERAEALLHATSRAYKVREADLTATFGPIGEAFWAQFTIARGEGGALTYPTEASIAELRPLILLGPGEAMCPAANSLYLAILVAGEKVLSTGAVRQRFFSARDDALEAEAALQIGRLLGSTANLFESVFETPHDQFEHDLVVVSGDVAFILEAKASPPTEPFRSAEKAFVRLRRAFRSDTGIQKGFEQAARIRRRLDAGETVRLYHQGGRPAVDLDPRQLRTWFCVCVTRDDFGPLATDLALLLEKKPTEPYPWVVNILDLEALADAWGYLKWSTPGLVRYLGQRIRLHGKAFSTDELDFAAAYIRHGTLQHMLDADADMLVVDPSYSDFFDELYAHLRLGAPPPRVRGGDPVVSDLRASLPTGTAVATHVSHSAASPPGRNDPCSCGSGLKYKRCCGRADK